MLWVVELSDVRNLGEQRIWILASSLCAIMDPGQILKKKVNSNHYQLLILCCYLFPFTYFSGNLYPGEKPYQSGTESCSSCPTNKPFCVSNLCGQLP